MNTDTDILKSFIQKIKSINFFQRLFGRSIWNAFIDVKLYWEEKWNKKKAILSYERTALNVFTTIKSYCDLLRIDC